MFKLKKNYNVLHINQRIILIEQTLIFEIEKIKSMKLENEAFVFIAYILIY